MTDAMSQDSDAGSLASGAHNEDRYRSYLNASPDGIAITDLTGRVRMVSAMAQKMLRGKTPEDIVGRPIIDFIVPEDRGLAINRLGMLLSGTRTGSTEYHGLRLDQTTFDIEVNAEIVPDISGKASELVFIVRDITDRKRAQDEVLRSGRLLRSIVETVPLRVFWKDSDLRYVGCNTQFARDAGLENPEDVIGKSDFDLGWREQAEAYRAEDRSVIQSGEPKLDFEEPQTTPDGHTMWLSTSKVPLRGEGEEVAGILGVYHDVTLRREADEALRASLLEKESLLKEIHHRVKNNLQVISSLLRLEAGRSQEAAVRAALGEMQGRVRSVAVLHETLYRTRRFGRVELAGYLKDLAQQFLRASGANAGSVRLALDLSPVEVGIDQGVPCGLILHELLTNSLKHAFGEDRTGEIRISVRPEPGNAVYLAVSDTGPGLPADFQARRALSLGVQLIEDLARQIGGRLTVGAGPGASFEIRFEARVPPDATRPFQPHG